ncbi:helix-turn-helix transcriptional regulator [Telmatobacter sp. DSM 110680]|uniref:Helix-turn-helix transcriptional regulator n=1 Tax=Telmatobacter sp. DSM 110680 TaxID=3036704 RepID=A0AAU7DJB7_9BACT
MSMTINNQEDFHRVQQLVWGKLFGIFIQKGREKRGCTVEEVAHLAGMGPSEWLAVEAGRIPESAAQLRLMAAALQFSKVQLATIIQICRAAWKA